MQNIRIEVDHLSCKSDKYTRPNLGSIVRKSNNRYIRVANITHFSAQVDELLLKNFPTIESRLDHLFTRWRAITGPTENPQILFDVELS